jgi:hypothetical protein
MNTTKLSMLLKEAKSSGITFSEPPEEIRYIDLTPVYVPHAIRELYQLHLIYAL